MIAYAAVFYALSLRRYDAFLMHALDMGNMEQAVWNTLHGQPFQLTNMLDSKIGVEAFGTNTRLSFHVEPIFFPLSLLQLIYRGPQALLAVQTLVLASGAWPVWRLTRRHLGANGLALVVFPLAYLLFPALQAANLYEFHPVSLTGALLLWAIDAADEGAYLPFSAVALAALACKEEIGFAITLLALWSLWRRGRRGVIRPRERAFWLLWAGAGMAWSLVAFLVIIPDHQHLQSATPYACRLVDPSMALKRQACSSLSKVVGLWIAHPAGVWNLLTLSLKLGFLHRLLAPAGYLALLSPLTLGLAAPGLALILLSNDVHMASGLAHYSAELVPAVVAAAIFGTAWLARVLHARLRLPPRLTITAASLYLLAMSAANTHANGFGPGSAGFFYPPVTEHERVGDRILAMIPPGASVSAQDVLDAHLSDRPSIYLYPYYQHVPSPHGRHGHYVDYIMLDVTSSLFPLPAPGQLVTRIDNLLHDPVNPYSIVAAEDGYLLLKRGRHGPRTLPRSFFTFLLPAQPRISHPLRVDYGDSLQMLGYDVERREQVNLRAPDVVLTTYWRVRRPLGHQLSFAFYLTNADGAIAPNPFDQSDPSDQMALEWRPTSRWQPGQIVRVTTQPMTVSTLTPGAIDVDMVVVSRGGWHSSTQPLPPLDLRISPVVRDAPQPLEVVDQGTMLKLTTVPVPF